LVPVVSFSLSLLVSRLIEWDSVCVTLDGVTVNVGNVIGHADVAVGDGVAVGVAIGDVGVDSGLVEVRCDAEVDAGVADDSVAVRKGDAFFETTGVGGVDGDLKGRGLLKRFITFILQKRKSLLLLATSK
jgi:hypothetical protein